ncbi:YihY/virulence factor BrkB family protein [Peptoniphilus asaccharolyticus]|nr:YihY/virulence factor BrkB family protein [Peptoniphilus asaccharolyticus]
MDKLLYRFSSHRLPEMSGSLVYFIILSLFPFIIALLNTLKFTGILSPEAILSYVEYLPEDISSIVLSFSQELLKSSSSSLFIVSILAGLWTSSNGINQLINNVNAAYGFNKKRSFIAAKSLSLIFAIALILMIILLMITQVFGGLIIDSISKFLILDVDLKQFIKLLSIIVPLIYMLLMFTALYKFAPSKQIRKMLTLKMIIPGALFTTIGVILMTVLFGFYVSNFGKFSVTYGSLGGVIVMLIWIWLVSLIILIGGEINAINFSIKYFPESSLWPRNESILKGILSDEKYQDLSN